MASDYSAGVLTFGELREKLREVYDDSIIATPEVHAAAQDMLAAATAVNVKRLAKAVTAANHACTATGN